MRLQRQERDIQQLLRMIIRWIQFHCFVQLNDRVLILTHLQIDQAKVDVGQLQLRV